MGKVLKQNQIEVIFSALVCLATLCATPSLHADITPSSSQQARIKDMATVEGIHENQLVGYGIVVGLPGTGDSQQSIAPQQMLLAAPQRAVATVPHGQGTETRQSRNMAAVFIVATLRPFAQPGSRIDVIVSPAGDAHSIQGGLLLMTPLYGPDGKIYAQAQGSIVLGSYSVQASGIIKSENDPTAGRIPSGAIVERALPLHLNHDHFRTGWFRHRHQDTESIWDTKSW